MVRRGSLTPDVDERALFVFGFFLPCSYGYVITATITAVAAAASLLCAQQIEPFLSDLIPSCN